MKFFLSIIILFVCLGFISPDHFYPWTTYDAEKNIFYACILIYICFFYLHKTAIEIDRNIIFLILLFLVSISTINFYTFKQNFYIFNLYLINLIVLSIILINIDYKKIKFLDFLLISIFISGCLSSVFSIYQWLNFENGSFWLYESIGPRFSANLAQPNHLSTLLLLALLSCVYFFNKVKSILILFFIPILLFSLVLTQSRSAWLALICIIIMVFFKWKLISRSIKIILFTLAPIYFWFAGLISKTDEKIDIVDRAGGSFERLAIWQDFFNIFPHLGIFGVGWKNVEYYQFQYGSNFSGYLSSYHNIFLDLIVIFGVLGGVFFSYLFFKLLVVFFRLNTTTDFIVFLMLFVLINHSLLEFPLFYSYFLFVFCILYFYLDKKYSSYVFNLSIHRFVFLIFSILVIGSSFLYIYFFDEERNNYRALFLGYCVRIDNKNILFDEFENLALINCKENISLKNISYFESGLLSRPSSNNILKLIYVYHQLGEYKKRDQLLKKYNSRYLPQYNLSDVLKMKFY